MDWPRERVGRPLLPFTDHWMNELWNISSKNKTKKILLRASEDILLWKKLYLWITCLLDELINFRASETRGNRNKRYRVNKDYIHITTGKKLFCVTYSCVYYFLVYKRLSWPLKSSQDWRNLKYCFILSIVDNWQINVSLKDKSTILIWTFLKLLRNIDFFIFFNI